MLAKGFEIGHGPQCPPDQALDFQCPAALLPRAASRSVRPVKRGSMPYRR